MFVGAVVTMVLIYLVHIKVSFLEIIDKKVYDVILRALQDKKEQGFPVIVDIDELSLKKYGQWPWPRYKVSKLIENISALGAVSVGLDIFFPEPDRTSLSVIKKELENLNIRIEYSGLPKEYENNDAILASTLAAGPFVGSYQFLFNTTDNLPAPCVLHPLEVFWVSEALENNQSKLFYQAKDAICNLKEFGLAVKYSGFTNVNPDLDGVIRRVPIIFKYGDSYYPSFALAILLQAISSNQIFVHFGKSGIESVQVDKVKIPIDQKGNMIIRYYGNASRFDVIPAFNVIEGHAGRKEFEGRAVVIGTSAAGLKDIRTTPFNPKAPGFEIHATVIENILRGDFISVPAGFGWINIILYMICGALSTVAVTRLRVVVSTALVLASLIGIICVSLWLIRTYAMYISPFPPSLILLSTFSILNIFKFRVKEKQLIKSIADLARTQEATIEVMSNAIEMRDNMTGGHIQRTKEYVKVLAMHLRSRGKFAGQLDDETIELMYKCAPLHDVGKIGVPDRVLLKTDKLNDEEFGLMRQHSEHGKTIIRSAIMKAGNIPFLTISEEMAYTHHEKWDSSGYPNKLSGADIPLAGRIMAVADVYDALISSRVYKPGFSHEKSVAIIKEGSGKHFDPDVVEVFLEKEDDFRKIALKFADSEEDVARLSKTLT
ncbi:CHASE2 domain-containing protein [Candidatus Magnetominusculus xianensis]|uniref:Phosphohydrolase n=1 Tax=Candidatus Magnetominusculus xianensis TaxID=1748249 RepID=A0ABR5SGF8_9BACT|nr:CHASE2 domain-containing protein [Candidatus Magnetominusculus xianensis]KWT85560.1 phosphohydrolase [Candidatus Magnetominusculus xianensis]MBF0404209.1 CHASE2 domain-containing protein [Nitrospirota bacterium]